MLRLAALVVVPIALAASIAAPAATAASVTPRAVADHTASETAGIAASQLARAMEAAPTRHAAQLIWAAAQRQSVIDALAGHRDLSEIGAAQGADGLSELLATDEACGVSEGGDLESGDTSLARTASTDTPDNDTIVEPAGKLDGHEAVLDFRIDSAGDSLSTGVTARNAKTGAVLWSRKSVGTPDSPGLTIPYPEPIGPDGKPGVLLLSARVPATAAAMTETTTLEALDGAGKKIWTTSLTGTVTDTADSETVTNVLQPDGPINDVSGHHGDFLVSVLNNTEVDTDASSTFTSSTQNEVISGSDGSVSLRGGPVSSTEGLPTAQPIPDVSGDGLDDIVIADPGKSGYIRAERGDTAATIWTASKVKVGIFVAGVLPAGSVTGGKVPDLLVESFSPSVNSDDDLDVSLIRGSDGAGLWTHGADCAVPISSAGPHHAGTVGLISGASVASTASRLKASVVYATRGTSGKVITRRKYTLASGVTRDADETFNLEVGTFGDVQPDGSHDLTLHLGLKSGNHVARLNGIISGSDGAFIKTPSGAPADGGLHKGGGTDLLHPSKARHGYRVEGYNGATGNRLYKTAAVPGSNPVEGLVLQGLRVTGHDCSDIGLGSETSGHALVGLLSGSGAPLWTVTIATNALTGGTIHHYPAPASYCAK